MESEARFVRAGTAFPLATERSLLVILRFAQDDRGAPPGTLRRGLEVAHRRRLRDDPRGLPRRPARRSARARPRAAALAAGPVRLVRRMPELPPGRARELAPHLPPHDDRASARRSRPRARRGARARRPPVRHPPARRGGLRHAPRAGGARRARGRRRGGRALRRAAARALDRVAPLPGLLAPGARARRAADVPVRVRLRRGPLAAAPRRLPPAARRDRQPRALELQLHPVPHDGRGAGPRPRLRRGVPRVEHARGRARRRVRGLPRPGRAARAPLPRSARALRGVRGRRGRRGHHEPRAPAGRSRVDGLRAVPRVHVPEGRGRVVAPRLHADLSPGRRPRGHALPPRA